MYSFLHLVSTQYWFGPVPFLGKAALWAMTIIFLAMLIAGIVLGIVAKSLKNDRPLSKGLVKIAKLLTIMSVIAFIFLFLRYEFVTILSRRFMFALWFVGLVVWTIFVVRYFVKVVPKQRADKLEQERINRYLP